MEQRRSTLIPPGQEGFLDMLLGNEEVHFGTIPLGDSVLSPAVTEQIATMHIFSNDGELRFVCSLKDGGSMSIMRPEKSTKWRRFSPLSLIGSFFNRSSIETVLLVLVIIILMIIGLKFG
jgi:hypothetical protein